MLEVIHVPEIVVRVRLIVFVVPFVCLGCRVLVFGLVEFQLDSVGRAVTVVSEVGPTVVAADHVLTFGRLGLLSVLAVADLSEQSLVLKLGLDLTLLFSHGAFV